MKVNSALTADKAVGFWVYHFGWGGKDDPAQLRKYENTGMMNVYSFYGDAAVRREAAACGARFWFYAHEPFTATCEGTKIIYGLKPDWKDGIARRVEEMQKEGIWDAVLGFDYDEPMLQSTNELVEEVAEEYARYGKRQLAIFSYYELIEGSNPRSNDPEYGKTAHLIHPQSCRFFTDIAFDYYGESDYAVHKKLSDEMKRRVGREDVNVWYVPCTWSLINRFGQDHALQHLETCYQLLKEEDRPGGLICYNWHSFEGHGESLDWLFADENRSRWDRLENRMLEISSAIICQPLGRRLSVADA